MPKIKTRKSASKRFKISKSGKVLRKKIGQDHFNVKESGKKTRKKRKQQKVVKSDLNRIKKLLPYA
ncbi:50S ribosomal protein L35 [bacterium]|nr:50S ribosomal protein L35 [bacterium]|tara:strand:- start:7901 stop:8098 length:198 start_codon:yes stop_codon:yes gene_type:complete